MPVLHPDKQLAVRKIMKQKVAGTRNTKVQGSRPGLTKDASIGRQPIATDQGNKTPPTSKSPSAPQGNKTPPTSKGSTPMPLPTKQLPTGTRQPAKPATQQFKAKHGYSYADRDKHQTYKGVKPKRRNTPQAKNRKRLQEEGSNVIRNLAFQLGASKAQAARVPLRKG